ncbi:hypothetical protein AMTRI_Chr04g183810 [Amborella trichopoda]
MLLISLVTFSLLAVLTVLSLICFLTLPHLVSLSLLTVGFPPGRARVSVFREVGYKVKRKALDCKDHLKIILISFFFWVIQERRHVFIRFFNKLGSCILKVF